MSEEVQTTAAHNAALWTCASCGAMFPAKRTDGPKGRCSKCVEVDVLVQQRRQLLVVAYEAYQLSLQIEEFGSVVDHTSIDQLDAALLRAFKVYSMFNFMEIGQRITTALGGYAAMMDARKGKS